MSKLQDDRRIDPRIKAAMAAFPTLTQSDVRSRDDLQRFQSMHDRYVHADGTGERAGRDL